jgi:hypothetical protein
MNREENFKTLAAELRQLVDSAPEFGVITMTAKLRDGKICLISTGIEKSVFKSGELQGGHHA